MKCLYYDFPNAGVKTVVFAQIIRAIILRRKLDLNTKNKLVDEELGFLNIIKEESGLFNTQKLFLYYYLFLFTIKQHPNIMQYHDIQLFMLSYIRGFLFIFQQIWSQTLCTLQ